MKLSKLLEILNSLSNKEEIEVILNSSTPVTSILFNTDVKELAFSSLTEEENMAVVEKYGMEEFIVIRGESS